MRERTFNYFIITINSEVFRDNILLQPASKSHNLPMANAAFIPRPDKQNQLFSMELNNLIKCVEKANNMTWVLLYSLHLQHYDSKSRLNDV